MTPKTSKQLFKELETKPTWKRNHIPKIKIDMKQLNLGLKDHT